MKIKQVIEDFIVDEIYDLDEISKKETENRKYYYFILKKKNYAQIRAIEKVARVFSVSNRMVHFAGTKDKHGITSQLISIFGINEKSFDENLKYFNESVDDLDLEFIGFYSSRLNLGDNLGNKFSIVVRDLNDDILDVVNKNLEIAKKRGVLNFFDSQRFGYACNSHIVGKYVLQNNVEKAYFEIITSLPKTPTDDLRIFVEYVKKNWEGFKSQDLEILDGAIEIIPNYLRDEKRGIEHLKKHKNDFYGAFRCIHKKIRTLYVNAYQSYIFNEILRNFDKQEIIENYENLPLVGLENNFTSEVEEIVLNILKQDMLCYDSFKLKSMPELKLRLVEREVFIHPTNIIVGEFEEDELNDGKKKVLVNFDLVSGAYATNVVSELFNVNF